MDKLIKITELNDFVFCPASVYYHGLYSDVDKSVFQDIPQIEGTHSHKRVDEQRYSTKKSILQGMMVFSERYNLIGKIDLYDSESETLIERKTKITEIYDGQIYQLYGQYFSLAEMGYSVKKLVIHSMKDNKNYPIPLPEESEELLMKFETVIDEMNQFTLDDFRQENRNKCIHCIYSPMCTNGGEYVK